MVGYAGQSFFVQICALDRLPCLSALLEPREEQQPEDEKDLSQTEQLPPCVQPSSGVGLCPHQ